MQPHPERQAGSRLAAAFMKCLLWINAGAAALLLTALLVAGVWQDAATDFVPYIALGLAFHGAGLLAAASAYASWWARVRARSGSAARALGYLAMLACAACAMCFAAGLATIVWGALHAIDTGSGYDSESRSL